MSLLEEDDTSEEMTFKTANLEGSFVTRLYTLYHYRIVALFLPANFGAVMGTGVAGVLLYSFPFPAKWLQVLGIIYAIIGVALFIGLMATFLLALLTQKTLIYRIHQDVLVAPGMGSLVMGYICLVNMLRLVTGESWVIGIWLLWWLSVVGSFYTACVTFFLCLVAKHRNSKNRLDHKDISLTFLLPIVTLTVASSLGSAVSTDLHTNNQKIITLVISFLMWSIAIVMAFITVTINFWRFFVHKIPSLDKVFTMFLPIGFLGQGGYSILLFGRGCLWLIFSNSKSISSSLYTKYIEDAAEVSGVVTESFPFILAVVITIICAFMAFILMAVGYFFTFLAMASLFSKMAPFARKPSKKHMVNTSIPVFGYLLKFHRGFWSMTFPMGTMALCNHEFSTIIGGFLVFKYIAAVYSVIVVLVVLGCLCGVAYNGISMVAYSARNPSGENENELDV